MKQKWKWNTKPETKAEVQLKRSQVLIPINENKRKVHSLVSKELSSRVSF